MAKCEKREIKPEPPPVEYVLTLTEAEAGVLRRMVGSHSGTVAKEVYWALDAAGVVQK